MQALIVCIPIAVLKIPSHLIQSLPKGRYLCSFVDSGWYWWLS